MEANPASPTWSVPGSLAEPESDPELRRDPGPEAGTTPSGAPRDWTSAGFAGAGPLDDHADEADGAGPSVPSMRLKPMTVADILDGAFSIIKARPARILGITALFVVPIALFGAFLQRNAPNPGVMIDALTSDDPAVIAEASEASDGTDQLLLMIFAFVVPALALSFVAAAIGQLVAAWSTGRDMTAGELLGVVGRRAWPILAAWFLVHVLETAGMIGCYIGPLFVMPFFVLTAPVIGIEGLGPLKAIRRSATLGVRRYGAVLGISLLIGLVATLLDQALGGLAQVIAYYADYDLAWPLVAVSTIAGSVISTPFVAAATVLLYLDMRVRTEGLDIELAARDLDNDVR